MPSGGSNYGLTNSKLKQQVDERKQHFIQFNQLDSLTDIPAEMLFASASGLDPHISKQAALLQVNRIANARNFSDAQKQKLIECVNRLTEAPQILVLGEERVNVLLLNLELIKYKMNEIYDDNRPNPDELLASLINEEEKRKRGKLKIFFGMCAGVGKTYTMLQTAQAEKSKGNEIIIGYIETHNRKETANLVEGFELIPRKTYEYKSTSVQEMDLDAIIARKPQIVLGR